MKHHIELLIKANLKDLAKNLLIGEMLDEYLSSNGLPEDPMDLNPQLNVIRTTESVVAMVEKEGITCTHEDVMLYWLTTLVYDGVNADRLVAKQP
jgi:hypothetical protein